MTTYHVLLLLNGESPEGETWQKIGVVEAHGVDAAKQQVMKEKGLSSGVLWAVPQRSYNVEGFEQDVVVRYVKSSGSQLTL